MRLFYRIFFVISFFLLTLFVEAQLIVPVHTGNVNFPQWNHQNCTQNTAVGQGDVIRISRGNTNEGIITSPTLNLSIYSEVVLTFKYSRVGNNTNNARINVEISINGGGTWQQLTSVAATSQDEWFYAELNLNAYCRDNVKIRFNADNVGRNLYPLIDDIQIFSPLRPVNDNCENAITIVSGGVDECNYTNGTVNYATESIQHSECEGVSNNDVWYNFVATSPIHTIDVEGNDYFDAAFEVLSGNCESFTSLGCQDNSSLGEKESASLYGLTIGETYYIRVYEFNTSVPVDGSFKICVTETKNNSNCDNATTITDGQTLADQTNAGANNNSDMWSCHKNSDDDVILTIGKDKYFSIVTNGECKIRFTFDNVTAFNGNFLEFMFLGDNCSNGVCLQSVQMNALTGLFENGLNSVDFKVDRAGTYYFVVDAQNPETVFLFDLTANVFSTGAEIDVSGNCGASYQTGNLNQGVYTTWNNVNAPKEFDASIGGSFEVCENIYYKSQSGAYLKKFDLNIGDCWKNIRNITPNNYEYSYYATTNSCSGNFGWNAAAIGSSINWSFNHPKIDLFGIGIFCFDTPWGDGSNLGQNYSCTPFRFCYTADIDVDCVELNGLQNVISATDDGDNPSNSLVTYNWSLNVKSVLPIKLLSFKASCSNDEVSIYWSSASELNNDYYLLERSFDGKNFEPLQRVQGAGSSNDIRAYRVFDNSYSQVVYYRLSQTDFDGTTVQLKTIAVSCNDAYKSDPQIYNESENGFVVVNFASIIEQYYYVSLVDATGRTVYFNNFEAVETNSDIVVPIEGLNSGVYIINVFGKDLSFSEKILIE